MGNFLRICIAVILILSIFTVSVFATPTGTYDLYSFDGRTIVGGSGSGNAYIGNFTRSLAYIHSLLNNISTTIDYYLPNMNNNLHYIHVALVDAFSPGAGDGRSMWQLTSAAVSGITAIQSAVLGIAQDVYNISTYVDGIEGKLDTLHSDNTSSNSKLDTLHTDLTTINTNIDEVETKLGTTNTLLYNTNSSIQSLETINWINTNLINITYSLDNITYYPLNNYTSGTSNKVYLRIQSDDSLVDNNLIRIKLPLYTNYAQSNIDVYDTEYYRNYDINYYLERHSNYQYLYIYPLNFKNNVNTFTLIFSNSISTFNRYGDYSCSYLLNNSNDFYTVAEFIRNQSSNDSSNLEDIKNILIDIDNNSDFIQNNNDLQIDVNIDATDGVAITGIINKLKTLFSTGVGLSQFLVGLNEFDNLLWFTSLETYQQVNYNPNVPNNGYQDLYD